MAKGQSGAELIPPRKNFLIKRQVFVPVLLLLIFGITLSVLAFSIIQGYQKERARENFQQISEEHISLIEETFRNSLEPLKSLQAFYAASQKVTREEFGVFANNLLLSHNHIQALEWIPRVTADERLGFEMAARKAFPDFKFKELGANRTMIPAKEREFYFPVYYLEPFPENDVALGFDLFSHPERKATLESAWMSGEYKLSRPIRLVQEKEQQRGLLAVAPVYQNQTAIETVADRKAHLRGFVLSVHRVGDMVEGALHPLSQVSIGIRIEDVTMGKEGDLLYAETIISAESTFKLEVASKSNHLGMEKHFSVAGREWRILISGEERDFSNAPQWWELAFPLAIFLVTVILAVYLLMLIRQKEERSLAALTLETQIARREETETRLNLALDAGMSGVWDWNIVTGEVIFSPRWFQMLEYEPDELEAHVRTWKKMVHPDDLERVQMKLEACFQGKTNTYECENRLRTKSGRYIWVLDRGQVISRDQEGSRLGWLALIPTSPNE